MASEITWVSVDEYRPYLQRCFIEAAELIASEQQGLGCLALRHLEVPAAEIAAYREWMGEPNSHELWMKIGDVHNKEARAHRVIALLIYAETLQ